MRKEESQTGQTDEGPAGEEVLVTGRRDDAVDVGAEDAAGEDGESVADVALRRKLCQRQ